MRYKFTTSAANNLMRIGAQDALARALTAQTPSDLADQIALTVRQAEGNTLTMPGVGLTPLPTEWQGERKYSALNYYNMAPVFRKYDAGVKIDRSLAQSSTINWVDLKAQELATQFLRGNELEIIRILANGTSSANPAFDGNPLLSSTARGSANSNLTTGALNLSNLQTAYSQMLGFTQENQPAGIVPTHLLVGPAQYLNALELTQSTTVVIRGTTDTVRPEMNALGGRLQVLVSPFLVGAWANYWFLLALGNPASRPVVRGLRGQEGTNRVDFELTIADDPNVSDVVRDEDVIVMTLLYEAAFAAYDWRTVYGGLAT